MFLKKLQIHNYKSLRNVCFQPSPLAVLVGPNASGKSNFASAVHFLSEVYSQGLEVAVARKGGYENIAFRKQRRSKAAIEFEVTIDVDLREFDLPSFILEKYKGARYQLTHKFSLTTIGSRIGAAFKIKEEIFNVCSLIPFKEGTILLEGFTIRRDTQNKSVELIIAPRPIDSSLEESQERKGKEWTDIIQDISQTLSRMYGLGFFSEQELVINRNSLGIFLSPFSNAVSNFDVYQLSTIASRASGVPTPNPKLSLSGENLPALIDWLQRTHPEEWKIVLSGMRDVLPGLKDISIEYLHTKTLGIFFKEEGGGHSWTADEVSDGTMQALALLTAAADPRTSLLLIEEPENSVHPWILRVIMERLREVSKRKNVIVTSHSPVLINLMKPEEVWVVFRKDGESHLQRLLDFDSSLEESWERGGFQLSDFLDSGSISQAVPGGVY